MSAKAPTKRPYSALFTLFFLALTVANAWFLRIEPSIAGIPVGFDDTLATGLLQDLKTPLKASYTGVAGIDAVVSLLVFAFSAGPFGLDEGVRLQQIHFLVSFIAILVVWAVDANRPVNKGKIISFTAVWALFYQTLGGAIIIALYYVVYALTVDPAHQLGSASKKNALSVSSGIAKSILPASLLLYLIPTVAMYHPSLSILARQNAIAFWQIAPPLINLAIVILTPLLSSSSAKGTKSPAKHLSILYGTIGVVCVVTHIYVLYACITSTTLSPVEMLKHTFLPSRTTRSQSTALGLHYIFIIDWWGIYEAALVWCWMEVLTLTQASAGLGLLSFIAIALSSVVFGPGATIVGVAHWREKALASISAEGGKKKQ